jgi:hypothetical protein
LIQSVQCFLGYLVFLEDQLVLLHQKYLKYLLFQKNQKNLLLQSGRCFLGYPVFLEVQ